MKNAKRYLLPAGGLAAVAALGSLLVFQVVWRPWAGPDTSWKTHLNLEAAAVAGYSRTSQAYLGQRGPLDAWKPAFAPESQSGAAGYVPAPENEGRALYISKGCASCHGLDARGAVFGADLPGHTVKKVLAGVRQPLGKMPAFSDEDLSDQELEKIAAYIASLAPPEEEGEEHAAIVLDAAQAAALRAVLDDLKAGRAAEARERLEHVMGAATDHDLKHEMEELMEAVGAGKMHDAEHMLEEMLGGGEEAGGAMPQAHLKQALKALEDRDLASVPTHLEQFIAMASGMDRIKAEHALELIKGKEYHDATHEIEVLLGMAVPEGH